MINLKWVLLSLLSFCFLFHQTSAQTEPDALTTITVSSQDGLFWSAYNRCDAEQMSKFITDDVEFYHDRGGITLGKESLLDSIKQNLCSRPTTFRTRREAIPATVKVYLLNNSHSTYGAIVAGEHYFFNSYDGKPEQREGAARFTNLWILKDGVWKMSRVLSYDHHSAPSAKAESFHLPSTPLAQQNEDSAFAVTSVVSNAGKPERNLRFSHQSAVSERPKLISFEKDGKWGYRDRRGKIVIPAQFIVAQNFSRQGIAAVVDDQGWAYIDQTGRVVIRPFIFDNGPDYFKEGLARFTNNEKLGFFDKTGKIIIKAQFDFAEPFHDGLAAVCVGCRSERSDDGEHRVMMGGLWGYVNQRDRIIVPLKFESAASFDNHRGRVKLNGKWRYVNQKGDIHD